MFFLYLIQKEENIINNQLNAFMALLNQKKLEHNDTATQIALQKGNEYISNTMEISMKNEESYIAEQYKYGIIIYSCVMVGIVLILIGYIYIVKKYSKTLDWTKIFVIVFITFILIIIMELLYIKYVLFNKKFNNSQIQLDFVNAIDK
jgi:small-conductance mechanosensitive channel